MQTLDTSIESLLLDPKNPRMPSNLQGAGQDELFRYLYDKGVLSELVDSFADNGFFRNEPLLVVQENGAGERFVVVEGNRRLAALLWMKQIPPGDQVALDRELDEHELERIDTVPVVVVPDRASVSAFLGYRHISGLKPWPPEAKARFISGEVDQVADQNDVANPFAAVGRAFGSNATGVRNAYIAHGVLEQARSELRLNVAHVQSERFGVWTRCLNSPQIRKYIGFEGSPRTYEEVCEAIENLDRGALKEVLDDLTPTNGRPALLSDSRAITDYANVLDDPKARKVLRATGSLDAARMLILDSDLADRLHRLSHQANALFDELRESVDEPTDELEKAADRLFRTSRQIRALLMGLQQEGD